MGIARWVWEGTGIARWVWEGTGIKNPFPNTSTSDLITSTSCLYRPDPVVNQVAVIIDLRVSVIDSINFDNESTMANVRLTRLTLSTWTVEHGSLQWSSYLMRHSRNFLNTLGTTTESYRLSSLPLTH